MSRAHGCAGATLPTMVERFLIFGGHKTTKKKASLRRPSGIQITDSGAETGPYLIHGVHFQLPDTFGRYTVTVGQRLQGRLGIR